MTTKPLFCLFTVSIEKITARWTIITVFIIMIMDRTLVDMFCTIMNQKVVSSLIKYDDR